MPQPVPPPPAAFPGRADCACTRTDRWRPAWFFARCPPPRREAPSRAGDRQAEGQRRASGCENHANAATRRNRKARAGGRRSRRKAWETTVKQTIRRVNRRASRGCRASKTASGVTAPHAGIDLVPALVRGNGVGAAQHLQTAAVGTVLRRIGGPEDRHPGRPSAAATCIGPLSTPTTAAARRVASIRPSIDDKCTTAPARSGEQPRAPRRAVQHQGKPASRRNRPPARHSVRAATVSLAIRSADGQHKRARRQLPLRTARRQRERMPWPMPHRPRRPVPDCGPPRCADRARSIRSRTSPRARSRAWTDRSRRSAPERAAQAASADLISP